MSLSFHKKLAALLILMAVFSTIPLTLSGHDSGFSTGPGSRLVVVLFLLTILANQAVMFYIANSRRWISVFPDPQQFLLPMSLVYVSGAIYSNTPLLDDDLYRYLWDGFVGSTQQNTFDQLPSQHLPGFPDTIKARISYQNVFSVYPPVAQWLFTAFWNIFGDNIRFWKLGFSIITLLTLNIFLYLAKCFKISRPFTWLILYQALFFKEFVDSCHIDILALFLIGLSTYFLIHSQKSSGLTVVAGLFGGLACLVKPIAGLIILLYPNLNLRKKISFGLLSSLFSLFFLIVYFNSIDNFTRYLDHLRYFHKNWVFNPGLADLFHNFSIFIDSEQTWQNTINKLSYATFFLIISGILFQLYRPRSSAKVALFTLGFSIIIQGLVNTWYIYWLWPFLVMLPWEENTKAVEAAALPWIILPSFVAFGGYPFWIKLADVNYIRYFSWTSWFLFAIYSWRRARLIGTRE